MAEPASKVCSVCAKGEDQIEKKLWQCARCKNHLYCGQACQTSDWQRHKQTCTRQNYLLRVQLCPRYIVDPPIFRTLSCPAKASFEDFHKAIQIAFGWASTHCYDFKISEFPYVLRIVDEYDEDDFGPPGPPEKESTEIQLFQVFDNAQYAGLAMEYEYDFGDGWSHEITLVGRKAATQVFMCTDGEGHGCAEDVGGPMGWQRLKEAYRASHPTRKQRQKMRWFETFASNSDVNGLGCGKDRVWAQEKINRELANMSGQTVSSP